MYGIKKVIILADKLDEYPSKKKKKKKKKKKEVVNFYWDRDMAKKSVKSKAYKINKFEKPIT